MPEGQAKGTVGPTLREATMRKYEIMFIVDPNVPEDEIDTINSQVGSIITDAGGEIDSIEKMGKRRLAYEVKRHDEGSYVLFTVHSDGGAVSEVERRFRVMDSVLRYISVRIDEEEKKLEKMRAIRQKRAARRTANRAEHQEQPAGS